MNEQEFEQLWQRAEGAGHGRRLAAEYPAWRQQHNRRLAMVASVAVLVGVGVSIFNFQHSTPKDFDRVYCNRTGTADAQWAELASEMLMES